MQNLKLKYNKLIINYKKAEKFFDDATIPMQEREKQIPRFYELTRKMEDLLNEIGECSDDEILNGFTVDELRKTS